MWSVTLYVSNLEKSKNFYENILGLNKKYEYPTYVGYDCGGVEVGLTPRDNLEIGKDAPTIQFFVNNVDDVFKSLKEKNVKFIKKPHNQPWGGRQARFQDPDGNVIDLTEIKWKKYFQASSQGS